MCIRDRPYSAVNMYTLVADISNYSEFLPYCKSSGIEDFSNGIVTGFIELEFQGIVKKVITKNTLVLNKKITMELINGPFNQLQGEWDFHEITENSSKISLSLQYELKSAFYSTVVSMLVKKVTNQVIESFITRAEHLYG